MNEAQRKYFVTEISKNKGSQSEVVKNDVVRFALECGLDIKKSTAKTTIVEEICKDHLEKFYNEFHEYFYVPIWVVADTLKISQNKLNALLEINALNDFKPITQEFKGRGGNFDALVFPLRVFELDAAELEALYNKIFKSSHRVRIETKTPEEVDALVTELSKVFEVDRPSNSYEHRSGEGHYTYLSIRKIDNNVLVQNKLVAENAKLKIEINKFKDENEKLKQENRNCRSGVRSSGEYKDLEAKLYETLEKAQLLKWEVKDLERQLKKLKVEE